MDELWHGVEIVVGGVPVRPDGGLREQLVAEGQLKGCCLFVGKDKQKSLAGLL